MKTDFGTSKRQKTLLHLGGKVFSASYMYTNISFLHGLRKKRNIKSSFLLYIMLGKLPFVLGYGVYCQNGGSKKIFFQFLTSCKKCLDAGKINYLGAYNDVPMCKA